MNAATERVRRARAEFQELITQCDVLDMIKGPGDGLVRDADAVRKLLGELINQRIRLANLLGCNTHQVETAVSRLHRMFAPCADCSQLSETPRNGDFYQVAVCNLCVEERRRIA